MLAKLGHPLLERHQRGADLFDLIVAEVAIIDSAECLALHELPQELHQRQHQGDEAAFSRLGVSVYVLLRDPGETGPGAGFGAAGHEPASRGSPGCPLMALTDEISACNEMVTRSTSAIDS